MIKAVSFDYGGVLNHGGTANAIRQRVSYALGVSEDQFDALSEPVGQIYRGTISPMQFWAECCRLLAIELRPDYMERWTEHDFNELEPKLYDLASDLRRQGLKTAIMSNITPMSVPAIRAIGGYDGFEPVILSCDIGFAKPDPEIYALLASKLELAPDEIVHIDDLDYCLEGARQAGLAAIINNDPDQTISELQRLLAQS